MEFTIKGYIQLLELLRDKGYNFCFYNESDLLEKCVILRHDVDLSIEKALQMAIIENSLGVKSTYFLLLSTNFYNVFSKQSFDKLQQIKNLGHEIGLHFDEKRYNISTIDEMKIYIEFELDILGKLLNDKVKVLSMHRPSKFILESDIQLDPIINSYSSKYFNKMKYISDSRMHWREDPMETIKSNEFNKFHILTHPFWYSAESETIEFKLQDFIKKALCERYDNLNDSITSFDQLIDRSFIND